MTSVLDRVLAARRALNDGQLLDDDDTALGEFRTVSR